MDTLLSHWIFLGLGLCLLYAPALWWRGDTAARLVAVAMVALALVQLQEWLATLGIDCPPAFALHEIALYAVAPLLFLGIEALRGEEVPAKRVLRHLSPLLLIAPVAAAGVVEPSWTHTLQQPVYVAAFAAGSVYMLGVLRRLPHVPHPGGLMWLERALVAMVILIGVGVALLAMLGELFEQAAFNQLYGSVITALLVLFHFLRLAYPDLTDIVADELRDAAETEGRTRRSQLGGVDVAARLADLERLMAVDHRYRDEDLDLAGVAAGVGLTPHQLSELVNEHLGLNFSRWLKQYRVGAARELLLARPSMSVLDVGLAVGFRSLSAFYAAFREVEGMAPGMYRKQHHPRKSSPTP